MEQKALERLEAKSVEEAIINQISRDFNLTPFIARTHFQQMQSYFERRGFDSDTRTILSLNPPSPTAKLLYAPLKLIQELVLTLEDLLYEFRSKQEYSYAVA